MIKFSIKETTEYHKCPICSFNGIHLADSYCPDCGTTIQWR